jgi:anti-sigma factor RsiW
MDSRRMRVSDAERERVASFLREQALEGRLDHDELEERLGGAYRAKVAGELEDLIEDLPHRRVTAPARPAAPRRRQPQRRQHPPIVLVLGLGLLALLTVPTVLAGGVAVAFALMMAIVVAAFVIGFAFGPFILIGVLISQAVKRRRTPRRWTPHY